MTEPLLSVDGLGVEFATASGWTPVLQDVSFDVAAGQLVGLVGESGSGKSVTCSSVLRLLPPRQSRTVAGRIRFQGRDLLTMPSRELEAVRGNDIAMIFQEPMTSLNPVFTVGDQIAEVVRRHRRVNRKAATARAVEVLDLVGIPDAARRIRQYPHEFSGGMRQRVMIAMALACEPKLLIADEPTTALDVTIQAQVLDLIREMAGRFGMGVLFVTHDLGVVADLCTEVVVMYAGQVVERARTEPLYATPRHPYTAGLLRSVPDVGGRSELHTIAGSPPPPGSIPVGCRFAPRCPHRADECAADVPLLAVGDDRTARCARVTDLILEGTA
ncbi:ABC transporter ATP-binding protein [Rhodococcus ruber]|uniref:Oligopeptide transporter subunit ATP-binding component of ABC superfamily n=1 Tax=Rhodococcus ruber TaxID=1830 RepID=A0A098BF25_9NOCA|nr:MULTISPECIES: ABC transporter ATP-binding protein [Rhodococcus]MCD2129752.1 ABC transporter ATP-binding protein [Rhodococcus ruber]MCZ1072777.1 ABC transporter ATP-binding protein [Rhodococcus sp. A5(2022)]MCZ4504788.1 ABC transporter ATP-binding protein [Rhodococcus ruber]MCZ4532343.1 ABC transporter ATP-binding protein [Rhodococcus ruber]MCZ4622810.1 ABC transporter ATP-binding protein [Rhodococcus ruber]